MKAKLLLSGNALKIIAAVAMTIDHVGLMFFPQLKVLRIIGRIALPIFAFMIAEGCRYTRNKLRYFLTVFLLASLTFFSSMIKDVLQCKAVPLPQQ